MVLADLGADVVRVRRPSVAIASTAKPGEAGRHQARVTMPPEDRDLLHRGKRIVDLDVKAQPQALPGLAAKADMLRDCFRPGTAPRWSTSTAPNRRRTRRGSPARPPE